MRPWSSRIRQVRGRVDDLQFSSDEVYVVGDVGPGDGIVFITPGTSGNSTGLYFEASPYIDEVKAKWCGRPRETLDALGTSIGTGVSNTALISSMYVSGAVKMASEYSNNGFSDWFLPSKDELYEMYVNREYIEGFSSGGYWSSSEFAVGFAWLHLFYNGDQDYNDVFFSYSVRPVRAFS